MGRVSLCYSTRSTVFIFQSTGLYRNDHATFTPALHLLLRTTPSYVETRNTHTLELRFLPIIYGKMMILALMCNDGRPDKNSFLEKP